MIFHSTIFVPFKGCFSTRIMKKIYKKDKKLIETSCCLNTRKDLTLQQENIYFLLSLVYFIYKICREFILFV